MKTPSFFILGDSALLDSTPNAFAQLSHALLTACAHKPLNNALLQSDLPELKTARALLQNCPEFLNLPKTLQFSLACAWLIDGRIIHQIKDLKKYTPTISFIELHITHSAPLEHPSEFLQQLRQISQHNAQYVRPQFQENLPKRHHELGEFLRMSAQ